MRNRERYFVLGALLVLCVLAYAPVASAQFAENTGVIQGTVKDQTGAVVPGAKVTIAGVAVVAGKEAVTDKTGYFRFAELPPGKYDVTITATSFKKFVASGINVIIGRTFTLDAELTVGAVTSEVVVSAAPDQVDVTSSKSLVNISMEVMDATPKPRGVLALMEQAPGVRVEPLQNGGFQVDGSSAGENTFAVEGQDTTRIYDGLAGVNPPTDFFKEVTIKSSGYEAEHGGAMGGVVSMVVKSAGSAWHGAGLLYFRHNLLDADPRHFLRAEPGFSPPAGSHASEPVQSYRSKPDKYRIFEPGFEIGGPIWKDRLFLYASYIPQLQRNTRNVIGTNANSLGPRNFTLTQNTHYAASRLDGKVTNALRAWAVWDYNYMRNEGTDRPAADDKTGLVNASAATDARTRRADRGTTNPNVLYRMGADWTPTQKLLVSGSYGKWFTDTQDRGVPIGVRHAFTASNTGTFRGLNGLAVPAAFQNVNGFNDIPNNATQLFDQFARTQANFDGSYVVRVLGTHTFKGGYSLNRLSDNILTRTNTARIDIAWGRSQTQTAPYQAGCAPVKAFNLANFPNGPDGVAGTADDLTSANSCRGIYGIYTVRDFQTRGKVASNNHALYIQDTWNVGYGVTLNLGVRFDKEYLPSFAGPGTGNPSSVPVISAPINFSFTDKVSPRIGGAWDIFRNGKLKVYGSWGWFYDIMKYSLPRGSFGGDYWHNCVFTLDNPDYTLIQPGVKPGLFSCNNGTTGSTPGTFLGEEDLRIPSNTASNIANILDPGIQPVRQTEVAVGGEWAFMKDWALEVRWAHKRLRNAIEDMGIMGASGEQFIIGNPGERIGAFPLRGDCALASTDPRFPLCTSMLHIPTLPGMPKARREYDGVEFRANKKFVNNWWINASYTYSRLYGNFSGLTNSDEEGRSDPNAQRAFDEEEIMYNSFGKPEYGRLNTDRPHTFKASGGYQFNWWGMKSTVGMNQQWYTGTPHSTRMSFIDVDILPYVYHRGGFGNITQDAAGNWVLNGIQHNARVPFYTNTDFQITHEFKLSKTNEALRLQLQFNALNVFNIGRILTKQDRTDRDRFNDFVTFPDPTCGFPLATDPCASNSGQDRSIFLGGSLDVIAAANASALQLRPGYGLETRNQAPRTLRLMVKLIF